MSCIGLAIGHPRLKVEFRVNTRRVVLVTTVFTIMAFGIAISHTDSFMSPATGGPGEVDCTDCHTGTVNSGPGNVGITAPSVYQPNDTIDLNVTLAHTGQLRWGFEITALDSSDQPIGTMVVSDIVNTQANTDIGTGRQYIFQTSTGTYDGTSDTSPGWTMQWAAPATGSGPVTFWLAGLAGNSTSGPNGDFCYTTSRQVPEAIATGVGDDGIRPGIFSLRPNFPNPFNPSTHISFNLQQAAHVRLDVFDVLGHKAAILVDESLQAGDHSVVWHAGDVGSGVYFYRLQAGDATATRRMLFLK